MNDARKNWLHRLHDWRKEHMSERMFMIILALIVGFLSAVAAFVLHGIINLIVALLTAQFASDAANWLYLVYPVIGIYLTSLFVRYIVRDNISHGITRILYAISSNKSRLKSHNTWSSVIASALKLSGSVVRIDVMTLSISFLFFKSKGVVSFIVFFSFSSCLTIFWLKSTFCSV